MPKLYSLTKKLFVFPIIAILLFSSMSLAFAKEKDVSFNITFDKENENLDDINIYAPFLAPGESIEDEFRLQITAIKRAKDFKLNIKPKTTLSIKADTPSWFDFPEGENYVLDEVQNFYVPFKISVPSDALPGVYESQIDILADVPNAGEADASGGGKPLVLINVVKGYPTRITVTGDIKHNLTIENIKNSTDEFSGALQLMSLHKNHSNIPLIPYADVEITDLFGSSLLKLNNIQLADAKPQEVNQGSINLQNFRLPKSYNIYNTKIDLRYKIKGLEDQEEVFYEAGVAEFKIYRLPLLAIKIFVSVILLLLLYWIIRIFLYKRLVSSSKMYTVQNGDNIQTVSVKFKVDGKKVIKANKLKAPYFLTPGQKILIPNQK